MIYEHELREPPGDLDTPITYRLPPGTWSFQDRLVVDEYLRTRCLSPIVADYNGWYPSKQANGPSLRLVIPVKLGRLVTGFWQARAIDETLPRYISPGPRGDAVGVVRSVFGVLRGLLVCEGPMDALAAAELGFDSYFLMGATPPPAAIQTLVTTLRLVRRSQRQRVCVMADSDRPDAMAAVVSQLAMSGLAARLVVPSVAKDLAAMSVYDRRILLREAECG